MLRRHSNAGLPVSADASGDTWHHTYRGGVAGRACCLAVRERAPSSLRSGSPARIDLMPIGLTSWSFIVPDLTLMLPETSANCPTSGSMILLVDCEDQVVAQPEEHGFGFVLRRLLTAPDSRLGDRPEHQACGRARVRLIGVGPRSRHRAPVQVSRQTRCIA